MNIINYFKKKTFFYQKNKTIEMANVENAKS